MIRWGNQYNSNEVYTPYLQASCVDIRLLDFFVEANLTFTYANDTSQNLEMMCVYIDTIKSY